MYWFEVILDVCLQVTHGIFPTIPPLQKGKRGNHQSKALHKLQQKSNLLVRHLNTAEVTRLHDDHMEPQDVDCVDKLLPVKSYMDVDININFDSNCATTSQLLQQIPDRTNHIGETRARRAVEAVSTKPSYTNSGSSIQALLEEEDSTLHPREPSSSTSIAHRIRHRRSSMDQVRTVDKITKSVVPKYTNEGKCFRYPFNHHGPNDPRQEFECDWNLISDQLWNLHFDTDKFFNFISEPNMTSPDFKTRLILVLISISRNILDTDTGYLPFLNTLLRMLLYNILTSKQIIDILVDIHYVIHCSGYEMHTIENEILYLTTFYIGQYQSKIWLKSAFHRLHGVSRSRYGEILSRIKAVRNHTCYCKAHQLFPLLHGPLPRPNHNWFCTAAKQVQDRRGEQGMMATDGRFVMYTTYNCINFLCNLPHTCSLKDEEKGCDDPDFYEHQGFSSQQYARILETFRRDHPNSAKAEKDFVMEALNFLKISICPCRMHLALRNESYSPYLQCPFNWSKEEKQTISQDCREIFKYTIETPTPKVIMDTFQSIELSPYAYVPDSNIDHLDAYRPYFYSPAKLDSNPVSLYSWEVPQLEEMEDDEDTSPTILPTTSPPSNSPQSHLVQNLPKILLMKYHLPQVMGRSQ